MSENSNQEILSVKEERDNLSNEVNQKKNELYILNKKYNNLLMDKCKKDIGRCFIEKKDGQIVSYCKIIGIHSAPQERLNLSIEDFNEYQYPALWFKYPYNDEFTPFYKANIFSAAWGKGNNTMFEHQKISYEEISPEEYMEAFVEVNMAWLMKLNGGKDSE